MLQRPFTRSALFYLVFFGAAGMIFPYLNVYFQQELGFSGRQIGLLAMFGPLMTILVAIPVASLADRRRWRVPILIGILAISAIFLTTAGSLRTFSGWIVWNLLLAITMSPIGPLSDGMIAQMTHRYKLNYGSIRLYGSLGYALLTIAGGAMWERIGFHWMFWLAGPVMLSTILCAAKLEEAPAQARQAEQAMIRELMREQGFVILVIASFVMGMGFYLLMMFDGLYMQSLGGSHSLMGLMFGIEALVELPTMHYQERLVQRLGRATTLLLAYGIYVLIFVGYLFVRHPGMLLGMAVLKGVAFGLFWVSTIRLTTELTPPHWAATAQSVVTASFSGIAPLVIARIGGEIYDRLGPKAVFGCASALVAGAALILAIAIARNVFANRTAIQVVG